VFVLVELGESHRMRVCEVDNQQREGDDVGGGAFVLFRVDRLNCMGTDSNFNLQQQQSDGRRYVKAASNRWSKARPKSQGPLANCPAFVLVATDPALSAKLSPRPLLVASHCCKRPY
jgi:hypothetical protein